MPADGADPGDVTTELKVLALDAAGLPDPPAPMPRMEFTLAPEDLPDLLRLPGLARTGRASRVDLSWHDTPDSALAGQNLALCHDSGPGGAWRLERLHPAPELHWPAGTPAFLVQQCPGPVGFDLILPQPLAPVAAFRGRKHRFHGDDGLTVTVLEGHLRGAATISPACRVRLEGPPAAIVARVTTIAGVLRLHVPRASLAAEAVAAAQGTGPPPRSTALPLIQPDQPLTDTVAQVIGGLLDALLHWSATAGDGDGPVPVHQMRVATRRLRSALSIFRGGAAWPESGPLGRALRDTAAHLGAARDWDVFLAGTGAQAAASFPDEPRMAALMASSRRKRAAAYVALRLYLNGPAFRTLAAGLACTAAMRPWEGCDPAQDHLLHTGTEAFAAAVLSRRLRKVRRDGHGLRHLPVPALHKLRKDCKRLRYAAEFFQPLFPDKPARRFIRHLAALQEALGLLNDGAAAAGLMAQLGRTGEGYAAGLVNGYAAASASAFRADVRSAWRGFRTAAPFWA